MKVFRVAAVCLVVPVLAFGHSVTLIWTQSLSPDIVADRVYCGPVPGGPYTHRHTIKHPSTHLRMLSAPTGTYYCVVTAINKEHEESAPSNEVQVVVP